EPRALGGDAQIAGEREHGAGSGRHAIQRGDDWLLEQPHVLDDGAGHTGELEVPAHVAPEELTDDAMHITAGAEGAAGTGQHDGSDGVIAAQRLKEVAQLSVDVEGQRVEHLGTVQRNRGDTVSHVIEEVVGHRILLTGVVCATSPCWARPCPPPAPRGPGDARARPERCVSRSSPLARVPPTRQAAQDMTAPPSTLSAWPAMPTAASWARKSATRATSSGRISRRCGLVLASVARTCSALMPVLSTMLATLAAVIGVST